MDVILVTTAQHFAPPMNGHMPPSGNPPSGRMLRKMERFNRNVATTYGNAQYEFLRSLQILTGRPMIIGIDILFGVVYGVSWMPGIEPDWFRWLVSIGIGMGLTMLQIAMWTQINEIGLINSLRAGLTGVLAVLGTFAVMIGDTLMDVGGMVSVSPYGEEAARDIFPENAPLGMILFMLVIGAICALNEPLGDMRRNAEEKLARRTERNAQRKAQKELDAAERAATKEAKKQRQMMEKQARKQGGQPGPVPTQSMPTAPPPSRPMPPTPSGGSSFGGGGLPSGFGERP